MRLESTREQDNGEVDPYLTPNMETADGKASRAGIIFRSPSNESVGVEPSFEDEQNLLMRGRDSASMRHDAAQVNECEVGERMPNDGASRSGVS